MKLLLSLAWTILAFNCFILAEEEINIAELKCEVCKATITELENQLSKVDPKRQIQVGSSKMDAKGNEIHKMIPMRQSEVFISDKLDTLCAEMENYARVKDKQTGKIKVLSLMDSSGGMNSLLSDYDFITDNDMNKSVKYYCQRLIEEYEDEMISIVKKDSKDTKYLVCTQTAHLCSDESEIDEEEEPYIDEAHTEL